MSLECMEGKAPDAPDALLLRESTGAECPASESAAWLSASSRTPAQGDEQHHVFFAVRCACVSHNKHRLGARCDLN